MYKQSNKVHIFIYFYSKILHSTCFERIHRSSSAVYLSLYKQLFVHIMLTVTSCSASSVGTQLICTNSCMYSEKWTADDKRCIRSKQVECKIFRISIYRKAYIEKYILLDCLYNKEKLGLWWDGDKSCTSCNTFRASQNLFSYLVWLIAGRKSY